MEQEKASSTALAYGFAVESYGMAQERYNALDLLLQTLMTLATTVTIFYPIIASSLGRDLLSPWYPLSLVTFGLAMVLALYGRLWLGDLTVVDPSKVHNVYSELSHDEFQEKAIEFAGKHFEFNNYLAGKKRGTARIVAILFVVEAFFLVVAFGVL